MNSAAAAWRLQIHETLPSTSDLCRERAQAGEPAGLAVMARMQTQGRGSRGRSWVGEPGNLFLSVLLRPKGPARDAGLWALLAGVAVADCVPAPVALKWPNDVMLDGAKLGGILIDSATDAGGGIDWLVIGIGLNIARMPQIPGRRVAALDGGLRPEHLTAAILERLSHWQAIRERSGWFVVREAWLSCATPPGSLMTLRLQEREIAGAFAGLGEDGSLLLSIEGRVSAFATGEVWREKPPC